MNSRRQLRKAVVDHISDSFLEPDTPLLMLMSAAREGREKEVIKFFAFLYKIRFSGSKNKDHRHKRIHRLLIGLARLPCFG
jgi:hypothetical protein